MMPSRSRVQRGQRKGFSLSRWVELGVLGIIVASSFYLRIQDLAIQSLWFDEAMSVVLSSKSPLEMMALLITEDIHPPLYPVLLHFWTALAGNGEFAARFISVAAGVLLIPLMYVTGRRLATLAVSEMRDSFSLTGFVGALLAGSSAFYIGYSQEARNYMLVTLLGLLSSFLLLRALPSTGRRAWCTYAIATLAALYSNYTAFLLLVFQILFVLLVRKAYHRAFRRWLSWIALVALLYSPWIAYTVAQLGRINDYWPGTLIVGTAVKNTLAQLVAGGGAEAPVMAAPIALALGLLALGVLILVASASRHRQSQHSLFLLLYLVVPTALLFAIAYTRPKFDPRWWRRPPSI
jgi:mannosyltransferase